MLQLGAVARGKALVFLELCVAGFSIAWIGVNHTLGIIFCFSNDCIALVFGISKKPILNPKDMEKQ